MNDIKALAAELRRYNAWRRGYQTANQPNPSEIGVMLDTAADRLEELERELAAKSEEIAIFRSDEKRLVEFAKTYRIRAELVEEKLDQERQDRKQADLDTIRALGERNNERALADMLANKLVESMERLGVCAGHRKAITAWKEARHE